MRRLVFALAVVFGLYGAPFAVTAQKSFESIDRRGQRADRSIGWRAGETSP